MKIITKELWLPLLVLITVCLTQKTYADAAENNNTGFWSAAWGNTPESTTIYAGMWSYHLLFFMPHSNGQGHDDNNPSLSVATHGFFAGTFVNTYGIQSYAAGVQRYWWTDDFGSNDNWHYALGYRLGIIYGYAQTHRWDAITRYQPFLPFPQIVSELNWKQAGVQIGYTADVVSAMLYLRF